LKAALIQVSDYRLLGASGSDNKKDFRQLTPGMCKSIRIPEECHQNHVI